MTNYIPEYHYEAIGYGKCKDIKFIFYKDELPEDSKETLRQFKGFNVNCGAIHNKNISMKRKVKKK